jgi:pimeloyl-ACP methyl ester carboxylesterase
MCTMDHFKSTIARCGAAFGLIFIVACVGAPSETPPAARFRETPCQYQLPDEHLRCGVLDVPENYAEPRGRRIQLPVAILESRAATPKDDPILYLNGGPGASSMGWLALTARVGSIRDTREVIVLEPRGAPAATPSLACAPEDLRACYRRFSREGVDLEQYNNVNTAKDVEALRRALGVRQWNLWGISYGTTWAMYVMRAHPEGVRAVVLDSPTAPGADIARADVTSFLDGLSRMQSQCDAQPDCAAAYGLREGFAQLNQSPRPLKHDALRAVFGERLTGDALLPILATGLQSARRYKRVPAFLDAALEGDEARMARLLDVPALPMPAHYDLPDSALGLTLSIYCGELHYSEVEKGPGPTVQAWPEEMWRALIPEYYKQCARGDWPIARIDRALMDTVRSAIPTLVLLGEQDPITSRAEAERALAGLTQGRLLIVPATTHGTTESEPCAAEVMNAFLNAPDAPLDRGCLDRIAPLRYLVE